jgi:hypothetical protein
LLGKVTRSHCGQEIDDALDGGLGAVMISGFEAAVGAVLRVWPVMEAAVGERPTQTLVKNRATWTPFCESQ